MALTQRTYNVVACDLTDCDEFYVPREDTDPPKRWKKVEVKGDVAAAAPDTIYNACTITHANELADQHIAIS